MIIKAPVLAAALLLAAPLPVDAEADVREGNAAWLLAHWRGYQPDGPGMLHQNGAVRPMVQREAFEAILDRLGDVDVAALATAAVNGEFPAVGDVWLFEFGLGAKCPVPVVLARGLPPTVTTGDQLWLYGPSVEGIAVSDVSLAGFGEAIEWTTKTAWPYNARVVYGGNTYFFCYETADFVLNFPFLDGVATDVPVVP